GTIHFSSTSQLPRFTPRNFLPNFACMIHLAAALVASAEFCHSGAQGHVRPENNRAVRWSLDPMSITITRNPAAPMQHRIRIRDHELIVDEAPANGGEDAGPDPHDLYDAALGACKALTMLWYARRKQIPLD